MICKLHELQIWPDTDRAWRRQKEGDVVEKVRWPTAGERLCLSLGLDARALLFLLPCIVHALGAPARQLEVSNAGSSFVIQRARHTLDMGDNAF